MPIFSCQEHTYFYNRIGVFFNTIYILKNELQLILNIN